MNTGMQDAFNLAWKLALVLQNKAGTQLLETYSQERSGIGDQVLRNAGILTRVALVRQPLLRRMRNLLFSNLGRSRRLQRRLVQQLCETDLHYRGSASHRCWLLQGRGCNRGIERRICLAGPPTVTPGCTRCWAAVALCCCPLALPCRRLSRRWPGIGSLPPAPHPRTAMWRDGPI